MWVLARGLALICDSVVMRLAEPVHALIETDATPPRLRASHFGGSEAGKADQDDRNEPPPPMPFVGMVRLREKRTVISIS